ncbi:MAG: hypothetical protein C0392_15980 [Syntrophus sp. (in: bacteria)]|nr:hypothetical protein [Syntrophus sp. (in: bacteria)]
MSNDHAGTSTPSALARKGTILQRMRHLLASAWKPEPLAEPIVPSDLEDLPFLERSTEVIKFQLLRLEYALSAGGGLRTWFKLNLVLCLILAAPALLVVPFVTAIVAGIATWSAYILQTVQNILYTLICLILIAVIIGTVIYGVGQMRVRAAQR